MGEARSNPLDRLVQRVWPDYAQKHGIYSLTDSDLTELLLECLAPLLGKHTADGERCKRFWYSVAQEVRHRHTTLPDAQVAHVANLLCALALNCAFPFYTGDYHLRNRYDAAMRSTGEEHYFAVRRLCQSLHGTEEEEESLGEWLQEYREGKGQKAAEEPEPEAAAPKAEGFDPKSLRLDLTAEEWVAVHPEVVMANKDASTKAGTIEGVRNKWNQIEKTGNWKTPAVRRLFFDSLEGAWLKDKDSLSYNAFCELIQSTEVPQSAITNAKKPKTSNKKR